MVVAATSARSRRALAGLCGVAVCAALAGAGRSTRAEDLARPAPQLESAVPHDGICLAAAQPSESEQPCLSTDVVPPPSRSTGWPWHGRLEGGVFLAESPRLRHAPDHQNEGHFWGTAELVGLLERAASTVADALPGYPLMVGELSAEHGGNILGHRSHESGRDADIGFYLTHVAESRAFLAPRFLPVYGDGRARLTLDEVRFDDARNWRFVRALLEDAEVDVQYVFVSRSVRARLLRFAEREGASPELLERAERVVMQPPEGDPHRDHFHVRVLCDASDDDVCRDRPPLWPWTRASARLDGQADAVAASVRDE